MPASSIPKPPPGGKKTIPVKWRRQSAWLPRITIRSAQSGVGSSTFQACGLESGTRPRSTPCGFGPSPRSRRLSPLQLARRAPFLRGPNRAVLSVSRLDNLF